MNDEENAKAQDLIGQVLQIIDPGSLMNKYVLIMEGMDSDGVRAMYYDQSVGATSWDTLGLLNCMLLREEGIVRDRPFGED